MIRWKMTPSYFPVLAKVAKFWPIYSMSVSLSPSFWCSLLLTGAWSLLREELNGNGTESGVQDDLVWVFHSTSWGWGGSSRSTAAAAAAAAAAKHALELVHDVRFGLVGGRLVFVIVMIVVLQCCCTPVQC